MSREKGPTKERIYAYVLPETNDWIAQQAVRQKLNIGQFLDRLISSVKLNNSFESTRE